MAQTSSGGGLVESAEPHPILPQLRLDDLLAELQGRLQAVMNARDRVHGLLEAVVVVGSNLELEAVQTSTARKSHRSGHTEGRLTTTPSGYCARREP
jgi:hypothetical protein